MLNIVMEVLCTEDFFVLYKEGIEEVHFFEVNTVIFIIIGCIYASLWREIGENFSYEKNRAIFIWIFCAFHNNARI